MTVWDCEHVEALSTLGRLLLGAAHADGTLDPRELLEIEELLRTEIGCDQLQPEVRRAMSLFDPSSFDAESAARGLGLAESADRRRLLRLIAQVTLADDVLDVRESLYLMRVSKAIGATRDELGSLTDERVVTLSGPATD